MSPDIDGFVGAFEKESGRIAETMECFEGDLKKLMTLVEVDRIVVFIDDLDRCSSSKVIETFETIKLFLNTPTCTFVIGADADKIKHAVGEVYGVDNDKQRQKDYLEKIVQIPFSIPAQDIRDIGCYVGMLTVGRHLNDVAWEKLAGERRRFYDSKDLPQEFTGWTRENNIAFESGANTVSDELGAVLPHIDVLARGLRGNPRQIKRFLNILSLRRQLGEANKLETKPELLVKFTVLEYAWDEFFNELVANVDPITGTSELLGKIVAAAASGEKPEASDSLNTYLKEPGLADFLVSEPPIDGETNLQPYLFLAQTSLGRSQAVSIATIDESTRALVKTIELNDAIRSKAAAKRAALDASIAGPVYRQVITDLAAAKDQSSIVNILDALQIIGAAHPELYKLVPKPLDALKPDPAVSLAASTLLNAVEKSGVVVDASLRSKFAGGSKIADALTKPRSKKGV